MDVQDQNVLVTFEINWDEFPPKVQQTKWRLTGGLNDRKNFPLSLSGCDMDEGTFTATFPPRYRTRCTFGRKTVIRLSSQGNHTFMDLTYDHAIDELSLRCISNPWPAYCFDWALLTPYISYQWNEHYGNKVNICNFADGSLIVHPYRLDFREVKTGKEWREFGWDDQITPLKSFGDREVFGIVSLDGIQLWCFNPNFIPDLPGAKPYSEMEEDVGVIRLLMQGNH